MDIEDHKQVEKEWSLCCSKSSPSGIKYVAQLSVASSVLLFSFIQIANTEDSREIYFSLISFVLGLVFPHPTLTSEKK